MRFPWAGAATALLLAPAAAVPAPAGAQTPQEDVLAVVEALFDAMRAGDSSAVRSLFHEEARLVATGEGPEGASPVRVVPGDAFVRAVGGSSGRWDERFWDAEVRVDGPLATVWNRYAFYLDGEFSHCGVDAFILAMTPGGWRIVSVADTRRTEGCEGPSGADPGG